MKRRARQLAAALAVVLAAAGRAEEAEGPRGAVAISSSHRFVASGMTSGENVAFAEAAEQVVARLEDLVGIRVPLPRSQPVQLLARWDSVIETGRVLRAQGWVDLRMAQKLVVINPERADQEDVLEALCWLLLNRCAAKGQSFEQRASRLAEVPDWLAVGVAQNLYFALRARNNETALRAWQEGAYPSAADLLRLEILPAGRSADKAFCGVLVEWLAALPERATVFASLLERCGRGESITAESLAAMAGLKSARDLEKHFELQIAQETQIKRYWGGVSAAKLEALRDLLVVRPEALGFAVEKDMPSSMTLAELAGHRRERWLRPLALALSLKMRALALGETGRFVEVTEAYAQYLDAVARSSRGLARLLARKAELLRRLERVDAARAAFEKDWSSGMGFSTKATVTGAAGPPDSALPDAERSPAPLSGLQGLRRSHGVLDER